MFQCPHIHHHEQKEGERSSPAHRRMHLGGLTSSLLTVIMILNAVMMILHHYYHTPHINLMTGLISKLINCTGAHDTVYFVGEKNKLFATLT